MSEFAELRQRLAAVLDENGLGVADIASLPFSNATIAQPTAPLEQPVTLGKTNNKMWQQIAQATNTQSIISTSDLAGNVTYVNQNFIKIAKYSREELIGAPHALLRSDFHPNSFFTRMWQRIESGKTWQGTVKNKAKDGSHYWVKTLIAPVKDTAGKVISYVSVRHDVTDLVKLASTERRLQLKSTSIEVVNQVYKIDRATKSLPEILEDALEILFQSSWMKTLRKGGVFLADNANRELYLAANHNMEAEISDACDQIDFGQCLCGRAAETRKPVFAEQSDDPSLTSACAGRSLSHYGIPILVGDDLIGVLVVYLPKGHVHNLDDENFLVEFSHALGVVATFRQRERELLAQKMRAEEAQLAAETAEQAKTNFLAGMSHEIRTPLNGVVGMLHAVQQSPLNEEQQEDINIAMSSADMLLCLINDILDFSKLEYGSMELEALPLDVRKLAKEALAPLRVAATEKQLDFIISFADDIPEYCLGDPTRMRQIATNLVGNAIKFTSEGSIRFEAKLCEPPAGKPAGQWALVQVKDSGVGIDQAAQDVIFERFSQADSTTTRQFGGTGLGLAICKQLVETMGGEIGVTSELGEGTCFWYKVPIFTVDQDGNKLPE
ncbi:sensory box histidine kinase/response regulator [hydrothermal vent metagenome]|uniref:histidine kinase n=1 Tax=hydrothermal vent metagenome TaxID=652676 RepID=A0A3B0S493_9ZZZZ